MSNSSENGGSPNTRPKPFVFVLMPFASEFADLYRYGIQKAAEDAGAYAERVDEQHFDGSILSRIVNQINKADVIVADMSGKNPNVFYEVGYAHALGKRVVLLTKDVADIPFDLKHHQHTTYDGSSDSLRPKLARALAAAIQEVQSGKPLLDNRRLVVSINDVEFTPNALGQIPALRIKTGSLASYVHTIDVFNAGISTSTPVEHCYFLAAESTRVHLRDGNRICTWAKVPKTKPGEWFTRIQRLDMSVPALPPTAMISYSVGLGCDGEPGSRERLRLRLCTSRSVDDYDFLFTVHS